MALWLALQAAVMAAASQVASRSASIGQSISAAAKSHSATGHLANAIAKLTALWLALRAAVVAAAVQIASRSAPVREAVAAKTLAFGQTVASGSSAVRQKMISTIDDRSTRRACGARVWRRGRPS